MAEDLLACSQKQPHPVLGTLRAPSKYLQSDDKRICWAFVNLGAETEFSKMIMWPVETALCLFTPPCCHGMSPQIDLIYIKRLVTSQGPTVKNILRGNTSGPLSAGTHVRVNGRKVELWSKSYSPRSFRRTSASQSISAKNLLEKRIKIPPYLSAIEASKPRERGVLTRFWFFQQKQSHYVLLLLTDRESEIYRRHGQFINHQSLVL